MFIVSEKESELLKIIGKYDFRLDDNRLYSSPVPFNLVEFIKSNKEEIQSLVQYLEKGKSVNASYAMKTLSKIESVPVEIDGSDEFLLEDEFLYDKIKIFWSEREVESYSSLEVKLINRKRNYSVVYLFDSSLPKEEREATYVNFWLIDWKTMRIYKSCCYMSDEFEWKTNVLPALSAFKSLGELLKWYEYYKIYDSACSDVNIADAW